MAASRVFLAVDDSPLHHRIYDLCFTSGPLSGAIVYHAHDGREGYRLFAAHPELTMVFLDVNMPSVNGLEFLARVRTEQLHPHVPIVLVTTEGSPEDVARGHAAGAWEYLRKPFTPDDITRLVERAETAGRKVP